MRLRRGDLWRKSSERCHSGTAPVLISSRASSVEMRGSADAVALANERDERVKSLVKAIYTSDDQSYDKEEDEEPTTAAV